MSVDFSIDFDISKVNEIKSNLKKVRNSHVDYGWLDSRMHKVKRGKSLTTAQLMYFNEFGTKNNPARPYLHITSLDLMNKSIDVIQKHFLENIYSENYSDEGLFKIASLATKYFKEAKRGGTPLSRRTIREKGHNEKWVETGVALDQWESKVKHTPLGD